MYTWCFECISGLTQTNTKPFMSELPAYAEELKRRKFSQTGPIRLPNITDSYPDDQPLPDSKEDRLRSIIIDLTAQVQDLRAENAQIQELRDDLDLERQMSNSCRLQIEDMQEKLRIAKLNSQRAADQLEQLQMQLDSKRRLASDKERVLNQLQMDYESLSRDFQRLLDRTESQRSQFGVFDRPRSPPPSPPPRRAFEDRYVPEPPISSPPRPPPISLPASPRTPQPYKAALVDNIVFGDESDHGPLPSASESIPELQEELAQLKREKEAIEWQVQRAPAPGTPISRARRLKMELEERLDAIEKRLGKVRLTLKQLGVPVF